MMEQINQRPEWVRVTCLGFGLNTLLLIGALIVRGFYPFGIDLQDFGFPKSMIVPLVIVLLIYMVLSMVGLWYGKKWGLALALLFTLFLAMSGLMVLLITLFRQPLTTLGFCLLLFLGSMRWTWELSKLRQNVFFR